MHEFAICQALIDEVRAVASSRNAAVVTDVYVNVGPLSGVEGPLMQNAFPVAAAGTVADRATLHLHTTPVCVRCVDCGVESDVPANRLGCPDCGNWRTQLVSGDELMLQRVVMSHCEEAEPTKQTDEVVPSEAKGSRLLRFARNDHKGSQ